MRVEREEHKMWTTWMQAKELMIKRVWYENEPIIKQLGLLSQINYSTLPPVLGQWHYHYYSDDGKKHISLVELLEDYRPWEKGSQWEICSGGTCSNCVDAEERFDSKEEAEVRIKELFDEK